MEQKQHNPRVAMWLSLILGLGQFYNKQKAKGAFLLTVFFP